MAARFYDGVHGARPTTTIEFTWPSIFQYD